MQSLKKDLILSLACSTADPEIKNNRVILLTAAGLIMGDLVPDDDPTVSDAVKNITAFSSQVSENYKKENNLEPNAPTDGNDGYLSLKDVLIKSGNNTFKLPFINVFFDQIIGVTIGNFSD